MEMIEKLPENIVLENDFIVLSLGASATNAINARTTVLLDIEKEDFTTPIFNEKIYTVDYLTPSSLNVPSIFLTQGYDDDTVSFRITGNNSEYFTINPSGNNVELAIQKTIPEELIFEEKVLIFNIIAEKPLTVGARAAISVYFPIGEFVYLFVFVLEINYNTDICSIFNIRSFYFRTD
ncbi:unnamed protein product [Diatraea saccharalis]|uniref:Uncharacterized protein n=1 Tax=Diatraea saccharalis TaxID=40085 RepID=A0A9N9QWZ2_9NEOP|nr:unnamed protein product [Diatraea saccharalis]